MAIFRYPEDRIPVACMATLFALDLAVFFYVKSIAVLVVWMVIVFTFKISACSWNHHHQHLPTFRFTFLNRLLEILYTFHTGITTNAWVLHHVLGHHVNYLDQTKDESRWKRDDGTLMGVTEYTVSVAVTGYPRALQVGERFPEIRKGLVGMGIFSLMLLSIFFYYNWLNALCVFLVPMIYGYLITCWHTYCHHAGLDSDDHFHASHNIMHRMYNIMTGNLGYHTAHHIKPGLHWSKLPEFHATIAHKIPEELYIEPCFPFCLFGKGAKQSSY